MSHPPVPLLEHFPRHDNRVEMESNRYPFGKRQQLRDSFQVRRLSYRYVGDTTEGGCNDCNE